MTKKFNLATVLCFLSSSCFAFSHADLWLRADQQGARALEAGQASLAANLFKNKNWQGVAYYRAGNYTQAEKCFNQDKSAAGYYNFGNALAHEQNYQAAIDAYTRALQLKPNFADAKYNKDLLEKLLKQQNKEKSPQKTAQNNNQQNSAANDKTAQDQKNKAQSLQQKTKHPADLEQHQAMKEWFRSVEDDPGSFLKQKFARDHQKYQQALEEGKALW